MMRSTHVILIYNKEREWEVIKRHGQILFFISTMEAFEYVRETGIEANKYMIMEVVK